jgi:hypothetical protein
MLSVAVSVSAFHGIAPHVADMRSSSSIVMASNPADASIVEKGYMYDNPLAPPGMGREFINAKDVRKPLEEFAGCSAELQVGTFIKGEPLVPWDPFSFTKLSKVSANNPDVAWLREAELKHCRVCMLAFVGILVTASGKHWPGDTFAAATEAGWPNALAAIQKTNPGIVAQGVAAIGIYEGYSFGKNRGRWDGLWFGEREGSGIVPGDYGFDPLGLMPTDPKAAQMMRNKELANGRLAMLAVMGIFSGYMATGNPYLF